MPSHRPSLLVALLAAAGLLGLLPGTTSSARAQDPASDPKPSREPAATPSPTATEPAERQGLQVPTDLLTDHLAARADGQKATLPRFDVFAGYGYTDRRAESGITFRHHIVDDAGLRYKPVHYDHGNGVVAADVDGDGRQDLYFTTQIGRNELWRNAGGGRFEDWTERSGLGLEGRIGVSATFADFDNDGDPDLYVTTVRTGNALFRNDGEGRFTDVTKAAGLDYSGHSSAALAFDYDNDGRLDLLLVNVGRYTVDEQGRGGYWVGRHNAFSGHEDPALAETSVLYRNTGGLRFEDVTEKTLLEDRSWSGDATAVDFNRDGWQDVYLLDMQGADHYYENVRGEFFIDRTQKWFPKTPPGSMGLKVFDWNRDQRLDLLITDMHSDMIEELPPEREKEKIAVRRGDVVLMGMENRIMGNALFQGTDEGFEEVSDAVGVENYWPWGVSVDDLNADGWDDVFITASMNFPFRYGLNSLLLNNRGERFLDAEMILGVEPRQGSLTQEWFDLDCPPAADGEGAAEAEASAAEAAAAMAAEHHRSMGHGDGDPAAGGTSPGADDHGGSGAGGSTAGGADEKGVDEARAAEAEGEELRWTWEALGAASSAPGPHPLCRGRSGPVTVIGAKGTRSSVIFDVDGDGDLDVVTNEFNDVPQVLVSDLAQKRPVRHLEVDLVGTRSNRDGLGARVTVVAGGLEQLELADGKSGYLSQSSLPLYFGLGEAESVDRVEIEWPSGVKQVVEAPPLGERLMITEPADDDEAPVGNEEG